VPRYTTLETCWTVPEASGLGGEGDQPLVVPWLANSGVAVTCWMGRRSARRLGVRVWSFILKVGKRNERNVFFETGFFLDCCSCFQTAKSQFICPNTLLFPIHLFKESECWNHGISNLSRVRNMDPRLVKKSTKSYCGVGVRFRSPHNRVYWVKQPWRLMTHPRDSTEKRKASSASSAYLAFLKREDPV